MTKDKLNKDPLFEYFGVLGMDDPKIDLEDRIFQKISEEKVMSYTPVIPKKIMKWLLGGFLLVVFGVIFFIPKTGGESLFNSLTPLLETMSLNKISLPSIPMEFTQALIGFGFFALVWILTEFRRNKSWI